MKFELIDIGRDKVTRAVDVESEAELLREVRKHLMSRVVEIYWIEEGEGTVLVGGFRPVGKVLRLVA